MAQIQFSDLIKLLNLEHYSLAFEITFPVELEEKLVDELIFSKGLLTIRFSDDETRSIGLDDYELFLPCIHSETILLVECAGGETILEGFFTLKPKKLSDFLQARTLT